MGRAREIALASLVVLMAWTQASSQKVNDATGLLKRVRETYDSLRSFQFEGMTVTESRGTGMQSKMEVPFESDFAEPYKMRIESKFPLMPVLMVSDGKTTWVYISSTKIYSKIVELETGGWHDAFIGYSAAAGMPNILQLEIADHVKQAKILREEDVQLEGESTACSVVEVEYARSKDAEALPEIVTYWIDQRRHVVLRESFQYHQKAGNVFPISQDTQSTTTLTKVRLNEPVPDERFQFTPPEGAKEGKSPFSSHGRSSVSN
jgi:outer membrane lipoprotein-sorting protein